MKILNINIKDRIGGASIAAFRHNEAMRLCGLDAKLLVLDQTEIHHPHIITPESKPLYNKIRAWLYNGLSYRKIKKQQPYASWSCASYGFNLRKEQAVKDADILILHWINEGMLSLNGIQRLLDLGKPTYWFMHDMWPITGGCHYSLSCQRYTENCGCCPMFSNRTGSSNPKDLSFKQLSAKSRLWSGYDNLRILTPSQWLATCVSASSLFSIRQVDICRNFIDTDLYKPIDKVSARNLLKLPMDKKLILFGADSINSPYKGWSFLEKSLSAFNNDIECVAFGNIKEENIQKKLPVKVHFTGKLSDDYSLIALYNACDVFVTPAIADNYPNVLIEAMSCGLPCVGFDIGGIPEIIDHKITGFIAHNKTSEELITGIRWVLNNREYENICNQARNKILQQSSFQSAIDNHIYHNLFLNED